MGCGDSRSGATRVVLALLLGGAASGLLVFGVGRVLGPEASPVGPPVIECVGISASGAGMAEVRLAAASAAGADVELLFLDADRNVLRTRRMALIPGDRMTFGVPTRSLGSTLRVVSAEPVDVEVWLIAAGDTGTPERRSAACVRVS